MLKFNRYLLSLLAVAGANFAPIQSYAQSYSSAKTERRTSNKKGIRAEKFNTRKIKITADKEQKEAIEGALQDIYSTPTGKDLLKRLPGGLEIFVESGNFRGRFHGGYGPGKVQLTPRLFNEPLQLSATLIHELRHSVQQSEGRTSFGKAVEGIPRFVAYKLKEAEVKLFDAIFMYEKGFFDEEDIEHGSCACFYKELREKYQKEGFNDKIADKLARTEFMRSLWESSSDKTEGPEAFCAWTVMNQSQLSKSLTGAIRRRNLKDEFNMLNGFCEAVGFDSDVLNVAYFMNMDHVYLTEEQRSLLESREKQAQKLQKGSCIKYCSKKPSAPKKVSSSVEVRRVTP